jgi:predicted aspartyl protease
MKEIRYRLQTMAAAMFVLMCNHGAAEDAKAPAPCSLVKLSSLDMLTRPSGEFAVQVAIDEQPFRLIVDTGSYFSSITNEVGFDIDARRVNVNGGSFLNNVKIDTGTTANSLSVGQISSEGGWSFLIVPNNMLPDSVAGLLGADFMRNYDVEFDFFRSKFNLFKRTDCKTGVYWTRDSYATLSFAMNSGAEIVVNATLDGKPVRVFLDTGSSTSSMSLEAARALFGWSDNDSRVKFVANEKINGGARASLYEFPFSTLDLNGLVVSNPQIELIPRDNFSLGHGSDADVVLGMTVLRQLHLYVSYGNRTIYLTTAEAK